MLQDGRPVHIVQLLGLVADSPDVAAFGQGDFADDPLVGLLLGGQVVVGDVAGRLEAVGEGHRVLALAGLLKQVEYLLVAQVVRVQGHTAVDDLDLC